MVKQGSKEVVKAMDLHPVSLGSTLLYHIHHWWQQEGRPSGQHCSHAPVEVLSLQAHPVPSKGGSDIKSKLVQIETDVIEGLRERTEHLDILLFLPITQ